MFEQTSQQKMVQLHNNLLSGTQNTSQLPINISSALLAYKGYYLSALVTKSRFKILWIIEFGASNHMINAYYLFTSFSPCIGDRKVRVADGPFIRYEKIEYSNF